MRIHMVGIAGTGMSALAGLLKESGHVVSGSDTAFHAPTGPMLEKLGITLLTGWNAANVTDDLDLVVIGNVARPSNPEAEAAAEKKLRMVSMPQAIEELFLRPGTASERPGLVVAGTHGKSTTTSLLAYVLREAGINPGLFVGAITHDFGAGYRIGGQSAPFVLEGDEYDSAFFEKSPKFLRYNPVGVILTSCEHDHIDIYPTWESYRAAFEALIARIPKEGTLVAWAGDAVVRQLAAHAQCDVHTYAVEGDDTGDVSPLWLAIPCTTSQQTQTFDLYGGGTYLGRIVSPLPGLHNLRNTVAAIALAATAGKADLASVLRAVPSFGGLKRRQELVAIVRGRSIYEDFAHHPTAVSETLKALKLRHPDSRILCAFEPRSATASRNFHQNEYIHAFDAADRALLAPVGRPEIAETERLDTAALAKAIGTKASACPSINDVERALVQESQEGDVLVVLSNGTFGGLLDRLIVSLA